MSKQLDFIIVFRLNYVILGNLFWAKSIIAFQLRETRSSGNKSVQDGRRERHGKEKVWLPSLSGDNYFTSNAEVSLLLNPDHKQVC